MHKSTKPPKSKSEKETPKETEIVEREDRRTFWPMPFEDRMDSMFDSMLRHFDDAFWGWDPFRPRSFRPRVIPRAVTERFKAPPMDLKDDGERFTLTAEMPGISKDNLDITLTENRIEIATTQVDRVFIWIFCEGVAVGPIHTRTGRIEMIISVPLPHRLVVRCKLGNDVVS